MHLSDSTVKRTAIAMAAMSVVLLVIAGYMFWHGDSGESPRASDNYTDSTVGSDPTTTPTEPETSPSVSKENAISAGGLGGDPFSTSYEFDNTTHKVVFRATSDGPLGWIGYRVRVGSKGGQGSYTHVCPVELVHRSQRQWPPPVGTNGSPGVGERELCAMHGLRRWQTGQHLRGARDKQCGRLHRLNPGENCKANESACKPESASRVSVTSGGS